MQRVDRKSQGTGNPGRGTGNLGGEIGNLGRGTGNPGKKDIRIVQMKAVTEAFFGYKM